MRTIHRVLVFLFKTCSFDRFRLVGECNCTSGREEDDHSIYSLYNCMLFLLHLRRYNNQSSSWFQSLSNICKLFFLIIPLFRYVFIRFRIERNNARRKKLSQIAIFPSLRCLLYGKYKLIFFRNTEILSLLLSFLFRFGSSIPLHWYLSCLLLPNFIESN